MSYALATISNPSAALTDFSLIVDLSRMPADWWTAVDTTDGTRGRVFKGDGETRLAADWIDFDDTAETGLLRVLWTGTLATTGTQQLWIEPPVTGNATVAANATYGSDNAYDDNWGAYWPMVEGTGTSLVDRTAEGNDATLTSVTWSTLGDRTAIDMPAGGYGEVATITSKLQNTQWTVIARVSTDDVSEGVRTVAANPPGSFPVSGTRFGTSGDDFFATSYGVKDYTIAATLEVATEYHIAYTIDSSFDLTAYLDGDSAGTDTHTAAPRVDTVGVYVIGASQDTSGDPIQGWDGKISSLQVHDTARSADWISSEYDQTSDQATFYGTWSWESAGDALTAQNIVTGSPAISQPTIGQTHELTSQGIATGAPAISQATLSSTVTHELTAQDIVTGAPAITQSTIAQTHALTSQGIVTGSPDISQPTLGVIVPDALTAQDIVTGQPAITQPAIAQTHTLTAQDLVTGQPAITQATIAQTHLLLSQGIVTGAPIISQPTMVATDQLTAQDIATGQPVISQSTLAEIHALLAQGIITGPPVILQSTIGQTHAFSAQNIVTGAPVITRADVNVSAIVREYIFRPGGAVREITVPGGAVREIIVRGD